MPVTSLHVPVEELIHGVVVRDPYRWLEDRNLPETEGWIVDQQRRCDEYFVTATISIHCGCGCVSTWMLK